MSEFLRPSYRHPKIVSGWTVGDCGLTEVTEGVIAGQFRCSLNMLGGMSSVMLVSLKEKSQPKWNEKSFCVSLGAIRHSSKKKLQNNP